MAGTLVVNEQAVWVPPGWIFDNVLGDVATELQLRQPTLAARILEGRTDRSVGYFDCTSLEPTAFREMLHAAERTLEKTLLAGPGSFHDPSAFPGYIRNFRDLLVLLREDPRAGAGQGPPKRST